MKKIIFHIGPGKSGSSSLQSFLASNLSALEKFGFSYPAIDEIDRSKKGAVTSGNGAIVARAFLDNKHPFSIKDAEARSSALEKFERSLAESDENLIVSSELFSMLNSDQVRGIDALVKGHGFAPYFVCYLRRHDEIVESDYAQQVKWHGYKYPIDEKYYSRVIHSYDFPRIIESYESVFGKNSAIIRVYEASQFVNGNLAGDFLASIGVDGAADNFSFNDRRINPSPSRIVLEIMRLANCTDKSGHANKRILELVYGNERFQKSIGESYIPYGAKCRILEKCIPMYEMIADKYFGPKERLFKEHLVAYEIKDISKEQIVETLLELI